MQVKDGSWYQRRDKKIVQALFEHGGTTTCGHAHISGIVEPSMSFRDSGRAIDTATDHETDLIREVSDPTKPLQLRVGGKYLRADGSEHEIIDEIKGSSFPFRTLNNSYKLNGQCAACPCDCDLICEILDPATEPELVLVGKAYELRCNRKACCIGENQFATSEHRRMVVALEDGSIFSVAKNGRTGVYETALDIIRPWIDPPTEFVFNGKRYRVGEEIKEAAK